MREQLRESALGITPLDTEGSTWAVATASSLVVFNGCSGPETHPWDGVEQGSWDGQDRVFTLRWAQQNCENLALKVPARVRSDDAYVSTDVAPFAKVLRQRVEATIVHSIVTTLPSGAMVIASMCRGSNGEPYSVTRSPISQANRVEDRRTLRELENRAREGAGLPIWQDVLGISAFPVLHQVRRCHRMLPKFTVR